LSLWVKRIDRYYKFPVVLGEDNGLRQLITGEKDSYLLVLGAADFVRGQPLDVALVSETTGKRAQASLHPYPIQAKGDGGCSLEIEILSEQGGLFAIAVEGFLPGEEVQTISKYKGEELIETYIFPEEQESKGIGVIMTYGLWDRGKSTYMATGRNCTVSVDYKVGRDASERVATGY
jgi:hypothetical protein